MPESTNNNVTETNPSQGRSWTLTFFILFVVIPVTLAVVLYRLETLEPATLPLHELAGPTATAPARNGRMLHGAELIGEGSLLAPEDLEYDAVTGVIYTGCADGWIKRVTVNDSAADSVIENWVNTGGRPFGIVLGRDGGLLVADAYKGLLSISREGIIEVLSEEAEGLKFNLTDCVTQAHDGMIYFTDATHKYNLDDHIFDFLEANPHGRLLSYDPASKQTRLLLHHLYFANGAVVSPDQSSVIFCETIMRRCRKYNLKDATVEPFIDNLPGMPDNIRYDGQGLYWIALATEVNPVLELVLKYPLIRKGIAILERWYVVRPHTESNSGVFAVDLQGNPVYHFQDPKLSAVSSGIVIGNHLYCGSAASPYILRLNLRDYPARPCT